MFITTAKLTDFNAIKDNLLINELLSIFNFKFNSI